MAAPYSDPLAYFLTWTAYGTWLPGDERGSTARGGAAIMPDERRRDLARRVMREDPCLLNPAQREAVEAVIRRHCEIRGWTPHAVAVRTNHVHVVVTAPGVHPEKVRAELKNWGTRTLKERDATGRERWWTDGGDVCYVNDEAALEDILDYVLNRQSDRPDAEEAVSELNTSPMRKHRPSAQPTEAGVRRRSARPDARPTLARRAGVETAF